MEKMEALKRKREASSAASSIATASSVTTTDEAMTGRSDKLFDPFAGIKDEKSFAEREAQRKKDEGNMEAGEGVEGGTERKPKSRFEGRISRMTALGSHAPTEEERDFARELTRRNKAYREKVMAGVH